MKLKSRTSAQAGKIIAGIAVAVLALANVASAEAFSERISVSVRGRGPDLVLIPGLASSSAVWDATAERLQKHYRLHIVQVAGFAGAPAKGNAQGAIIQPTVDAIDAYIKSKKLKAPIIIGHSLGGSMGLMLAMQHPEDASKLMIVDSLPFFSILFGATNVDSAKPQAALIRDSIVNETQEAYVKDETEAFHTLVKSPEPRKIATQWAVTSDKSVVGRAMYEAMTTDLRPKLRGVQTPITILYPWDSSTGIPQTIVDGVYRESFAPLPNKAFMRIDGAYHFLTLDQPEAFATQVDAFLK